jgi:hypothetical protein
MPRAVPPESVGPKTEFGAVQLPRFDFWSLRRFSFRSGGCTSIAAVPIAIDHAAAAGCDGLGSGPPELLSDDLYGALNDGGPVRQFGWGRFGLELGDVNGNSRAVLAKPLLEVNSKNSEAVGYFRAERLTTHL